MKICKVLIVEDDTDIRELLSGTFADQGYRFVMATNAAEMRSALAAAPMGWFWLQRRRRKGCR